MSTATEDDHDHDGPDGGCSRCEATGACPTCGSASPWRCCCVDDDEDEDESAEDEED